MTRTREIEKLKKSIPSISKILNIFCLLRWNTKQHNNKAYKKVHFKQHTEKYTRRDRWATQAARNKVCIKYYLYKYTRSALTCFLSVVLNWTKLEKLYFTFFFSFIYFVEGICCIFILYMTHLKIRFHSNSRSQYICSKHSNSIHWYKHTCKAQIEALCIVRGMRDSLYIYYMFAIHLIFNGHNFPSF